MSGPGGVRAALVAMVAVTAVWGSTFLVVQDAVDRMPVTDFLTWRFGIATLAMVVLRPRSVRALPAHGLRTGALLGLALATGYLLQTLGLQTTPASVSGFLTGLFVVFTPLLGALLLRSRVSGTAWAAVGVATVGLGLISLHGFSIGGGELLTVGCAVAFALHIVGLGRWAASYDAYALAVPQLATTTLLCAVVALPGGLAVPPDAGVWAALALTSLLATAVAFVVQTWAQQRLTATRTAVVMTMEPVFALLFGIGVGGDRIGPRGFAGAGLVLVAMLLVEVGPRRGAEGAVQRLEV